MNKLTIRKRRKAFFFNYYFKKKILINKKFLVLLKVKYILNWFILNFNLLNLNLLIMLFLNLNKIKFMLFINKKNQKIKLDYLFKNYFINNYTIFKFKNSIVINKIIFK